MALTLIADALGPSREEEAVRLLQAQDNDGKMHPNPLIISMSDAAMHRGNALHMALSAASPRYVKWREFWLKAAVDPMGHWERSRKARFRRRNSA